MPTCGLEIEDNTIFMARENRSKKNHFDLDSCLLSSLDSSLKKSSSLAISLPSEYTLIRSCFIPAKTLSEAKKALPYQLEQLTFLNPQECIQKTHLIKKDEGGYHFRIYLTPKDKISSFLQKLKESSIDPEYLYSEYSALESFCQKFSPEKDNVYVLYLGKSKTICLKIEKGHVKDSVSLPYGKEHFIQALLLDLPDLEDQIEQKMKKILLDASLQYFHFYSFIQEWKKAIERAFVSFDSSEEKKSLEKIPLFITGYYHAFFNIPSFVENPELFSSIILSNKPSYDSHALSIGCALLCKQNNINFRAGEFTSPFYKRTFVFYLVSYIFLCLIFSCFFYWQGSKELNKKESFLKKTLIKTIESDSYLKEKKINLNTSLEELIRNVKKHTSYNLQNPFLKKQPEPLSNILFHLNENFPIKNMLSIEYEWIEKKSESILTITLKTDQEALRLKDSLKKHAYFNKPICTVEQKKNTIQLIVKL
jgi:hypothetical protein